MSFAQLGLREPLTTTLAALAYQMPTPIQRQAIPAILAGRDVMAAAQTGTGKTAAFLLPLLQGLIGEDAVPGAGGVRVLILVPTRELAEQVMESCCRYAATTTIECYAAYGGVKLGPQLTRLQAGVDVLVATPGRLVDLLTRRALKLHQLRAVVLDEADRMLDLGFAEDLTIIFQSLPRQRQTLLFSATFADAVRGLARSRLRDPVNIEVSPRNSAATTVKQWVVPVDKKRKGDLFLFMWRDRNWQQVLVFVKTKKTADELAARLQSKQIAAEAIHGDRPQASRLAALGAFRDGSVKVLVATDVAARGLDIDGLPQVVNFDLPLQAEDYVHRIGRTGRAGAAGEAISFVCADEAPLLAAVENLLKKPLSRDEEPGFEPSHRVPPTAGPGAVTRRPSPSVKVAAKPAGRRGVPGNWVDFDSGSRSRRPSAGRSRGK